MGINLEYMTLLQSLKKGGHLHGGTVLEFGAQDISADHAAMSKHARRFSTDSAEIRKIETAEKLYQLFDYAPYKAIDASGEYGALVFDLNVDVPETYNFYETFDLVTNLGTIEHYFNPAKALENIHRLCKAGGIMIHAFPSCGNANHGLYNMQPRLFALLARANGYEILNFSFTVDYKPKLRKFSYDHYRMYDDRDLMCYVVFKKQQDSDFISPFDSIFDDKNKLPGYRTAIDINEFRSYIKGTWANVRPGFMLQVPTREIQAMPVLRRLIKFIIDAIGRVFSY